MWALHLMQIGITLLVIWLKQSYNRTYHQEDPGQGIFMWMGENPIIQPYSGWKQRMYNRVIDQLWNQFFAGREAKEAQFFQN